MMIKRMYVFEIGLMENDVGSKTQDQRNLDIFTISGNISTGIRAKGNTYPQGLGSS